MNNRKMQIISQLMDELQEEMSHGEDDFMSRLGRKKPDVEVVKIEGKQMGDEDMLGSEDGEDEDDDFGDEDDLSLGSELLDETDEDDDSPDAVLKRRLMALRGR